VIPALRSLLYYLGAVPATMFFGTLALLMRPKLLPFAVRYAVLSRWAWFIIWWLRVTCGVRWRVTGLENIPPGRAAIILCKHQSAWETCALLCFFPPQSYVLKQELIRVPFLGWGLHCLEPIAIDRAGGAKALKQLAEEGRQHLERGIWIAIYPEGTRVAPGTRRPYEIGGAFLAKKTGYPVIPVAHNSGLFWPRNGFLKRPGTIDMVVGAPLEPAGRSTAEINRAVEEWIEARVEEISRPVWRARGEDPPCPPPPTPEATPSAPAAAPVVMSDQIPRGSTRVPLNGK
jgi:1-acyl-sn-glycerol-3-phosphate acyltransferase